MKNWTIGKRITLASGLLCALLALVGAIAWNSLGSIRQEALTLKGDVMPGMIQSSSFYSFLAKIFIRTQIYADATTPEQRAELRKDIDEFTTKVDAALKAYAVTITQPEDRALFTKMEAIKEDYRGARAHFVQLVDAGKKDEAGAYMQATLFPNYRRYAAAAEDLLDYNAKNGDALALAIDLTARRTNTVVLIVTGAALVIGFAVGFVIIRSTKRVLVDVCQQLDAGAEQTAAAANQVSASSQSLAEGSSEQAASLEETSASLTEIGSMTSRNAESATQAKALSNQTRQAAEAGASSMAEMKQAMDAIKDSSSGIAKIVKTIDEIAFQTNILALNAAVEAARAGEAGAGFAVVADEVRALAQRSAQSAKETATKIEDSVARSENGVRISSKVAGDFEEIVAKAQKVDELVGEIAAASQEQNQGVSQINSAMSQLDKVTQSNAASAEESASAAEEMSAQAEMMRESVRSLRQLVDGSAQNSGLPAERRKAPAAQKPKHKPAPAAVSRPAAPVHETVHLSTPRRGQGQVPAVNGNGHDDEFFAQ